MTGAAPVISISTALARNNDTGHDAQFDVALCWVSPRPIVHHGGRIESLQAALMPAEDVFVRNCVERRALEFTAGRGCARQVLATLGLPEQALPMGARREPLWPQGIVGSISHAAGYCVAAACHREQLAGIGIDIEAATPLSDSLFALVCTPHEQRRFSAQPERLRGLLAKFLFSAKESVFKCLYPVFRKELEFEDVEVDLDLNAGRFTARVSGTALDADADLEIPGRLACTSQLVMTSVMLRHANMLRRLPLYRPAHILPERPFRHCWN